MKHHIFLLFLTLEFLEVHHFPTQDSTLFTTKGLKVSKNYIRLLTCCSTRAVHLEVCDNLTVQSFLMSFRRFAARRRLPRSFVSDNVLKFKTASKEVSKIVRSTEVKDFLVYKGID